jgi:hypothetical protein
MSPAHRSGGAFPLENAVKFMVRAAWLAVLGLAVANCSSSGSAPSAPTRPTAAATMPTTSGGGVTMLADPDARLFSVTAADSPGGRPPCEFDPATGQFECPPQSRDGITFTRQFTLYNANGNVQPRFDKTTAAIWTETTADGTTTRANGGVVTIHRSGEMMTTGLGPGAASHTLNGREHGTITATMTAAGGEKVTTTTTIDGTTVNLVVPVQAGDRSRAYPLSGTRVHTTTTTRWGGNGPQTERRQETFDGTNIVRVELTVNGVTRQCSYDLATKTSTCRQRP